MDLGQKPRSYCPHVLSPGSFTHSRTLSWGLTWGINEILDTDWPTPPTDLLYPTIDFQDQFREDHKLVTLHFIVQSALHGSVDPSALRKAPC